MFTIIILLVIFVFIKSDKIKYIYLYKADSNCINHSWRMNFHCLTIIFLYFSLDCSFGYITYLDENLFIRKISEEFGAQREITLYEAYPELLFKKIDLNNGKIPGSQATPLLIDGLLSSIIKCENQSYIKRLAIDCQNERSLIYRSRLELQRWAFMSNFCKNFLIFFP